MAIPHIYWARAFFQQFCDQQDIESYYQGMEIFVVGPIFSHRNTEGNVGQQYPYYTEQQPFSYYLLLPRH